MTGIGIVIGLAGALALTRVLGTLLYDVSVTDSVTFAVTTAVLAAAALLAALDSCAAGRAHRSGAGAEVGVGRLPRAPRRGFAVTGMQVHRPGSAT